MSGNLTSAQEAGIVAALREMHTAERERVVRGFDDGLRALALTSSPELPAMVEALVEATPRVKWSHAPVDVFGAVEGVGQAMAIPIVAPPRPALLPPHKPNRAERRHAARKARR